MDPPKVIAIVDLGYLKSVNAWLDMAHSLLSASETHQWLGVQLRSKGAIDPSIVLPLFERYHHYPTCHWNLIQPLPGLPVHVHLPRNQKKPSSVSFSRSIHGPEDLLKNNLLPHWFQLAPIFHPTHKPGMPLGLSKLKEVIELSKRPIVAVGGITLENAHLVADAGAAGVGCIGSILSAENPLRAAQEIHKRIKK